MKTYRATVWLMKDDDIVKMKIMESNVRSKTEFQASAFDELMFNRLPEEGYHVSFGPISEKVCKLYELD